MIRRIWDRIVAVLLRIPQDKWMHLVAGLIVAAFAAMVCGCRWCIVPALVAGLLKELFDYITTRTADWRDLVATVAGGLIIQIFAILP